MVRIGVLLIFTSNWRRMLGFDLIGGWTSRAITCLKLSCSHNLGILLLFRLLHAYTMGIRLVYLLCASFLKSHSM